MIEEALASPEPLVAVAADRFAATLVVKLMPEQSRPELRHGRSAAVIQVLRGRAELTGFLRASLAAPQVAFIPAGSRYAVRNPGPEPLAFLLVLAPGVSRLDERPLGAALCPFCTAEIAVEPGDLPGDRFLCPDCGGHALCPPAPPAA